MKTQLNTIAASVYRKLAGFFALCLVMGLSLALAPKASYAQSGGGTPPANTTIGNQATATYKDANGNSQQVSSNTVNTTVQQVYSVSVSSGITQSVTPGNQVTFTHTVTNNGNGTDNFDLTTGTGANTDFAFSNITIYTADGNGNRVPGSSAITNTGAIAAGGTKNVVIVATVPTGVSNGDKADIKITATSNNDASASDNATDTGTVSSTVISAQKSLSKYSGPASTSGNPQKVTVTLTFTNNGTADANNFVATDKIKSGFTYVSGSAKINGTVVTDGDNSNDDGYKYDSNTQTVTADLGTIAAGGTTQQKTVTFEVKVDAATEGQTITNRASYTDDDLGSGNTQQTNQVQYTVNQTYGVSLHRSAQTVTQASANQGETITFANFYYNTGSTSDRFNMTTSNSTYPAGTVFKFYKGDGSGNIVGPLTDSNNDNVPDIGPISSDTGFEVILQVTLPANATGGPYTVDKTATSIGDNTQSATHTDELTTITASSVDVTNNGAFDANNAADGQGVHATGETTAVTTNTVNATSATTTSFDLYINNRGNTADSYDLVAGTVSGSTFNPGLPSGYSVQFKNTSTGNVITNTGQISSKANLEVTAIVSVPAGANAGGQAVYFRAKSSATGALDVKHDAITIQTVRKLTLTANDNATVAPGGNVTYTATLTNNGNVTENGGTTSSPSDLKVNLDNSVSNNWTATVYIDADNDGQIDNGETALTTASAGSTVDLSSTVLAPGDQVHFIVKVFTNSSVNDGDDNTTTLTVSDGNSEVSSVNIKDITTVVAGNLQIVKKQRVHKNSGTQDSYVSTSLNAKPGDTIDYQLKVTNNGSADVTNVDVTDQAPQFTTVSTAAAATNPSTGNSPTITSDGSSTGTVEVNLSTLGAGKSFTITFSVKIDN